TATPPSSKQPPPRTPQPHPLRITAHAKPSGKSTSPGIQNRSGPSTTGRPTPRLRASPTHSLRSFVHLCPTDRHEPPTAHGRQTRRAHRPRVPREKGRRPGLRGGQGLRWSEANLHGAAVPARVPQRSGV